MSEQNTAAFMEAQQKKQEQRYKEYAEAEAVLAHKAMGFEQRLRSVKFAVLAATLVTAIAAMGTVTSKFLGWDSDQSRLVEAISFPNAPKFATLDELNEVKAAAAIAQATLESAIKQVGQPEDSGSSVAQHLELSSLKASIQGIDSRLAVMERSISDNPEKALSIPILRKDQENMARSIESNKLAVSTELSRIYDQQKWILGGVGTILFAVVTALFSALFRIVFKSKGGE